MVRDFKDAIKYASFWFNAKPNRFLKWCANMKALRCLCTFENQTTASSHFDDTFISTPNQDEARNTIKLERMNKMLRAMGVVDELTIDNDSKQNPGTSRVPVLMESQ